MPFTVTIAGRPNVGKSTLFNRLTGRRIALVDKTPGLTRDRRMANATIAGRRMTVVDTAGLEDADPGTISARMRAQSELAIREADLVLFVIDARAGIIAGDELFAQIVRESGRPVLLLANKCEGRQGLDGAYEAFSLGLGEPVAISAEHGEGMGELYRLIIERFDDHAMSAAETEAAARAAADSEKAAASGPAPEADAGAKGPADGETAGEDAGSEGTADAAPLHALKVAIVGRPNAGKSTLVNSLLGEERMITGPEPGLTRDSIAVDLTWTGRAIRLFDTAGLRRKSRIHERPEQLSVGDALRAIRFAEVVVLLLDAESPFDKQDLAIADLVAREGRALVIAINKWDLVEDKPTRLRALREEAERLLPQIRGVPLVTLSALSGSGLERLRKAVLAMEEAWNRRISTAALNRYLAEATGRHAPPAVSGRRVRLRYMTQPNARPPTFIVFTSRPEALPEAYQRYLVNGLREAFDLPGVPIRLHWRKGKNPFAEG
ncbi:MAG: ribosome biogenesis GTPase Der [Rhizobiales bacterium]|nr:ribosome biogenesis GTPase Der [Hyphomicrobiales bacterium]